MSDTTWKSYERRVARLLGGRRIPVTGIGRGDRDVEAGPFWYQAKLRRALPSWLFEWLDGIVITAQAANKIGVVVLKTPGMQVRDSLVVLRLGDWIDLHGGQGETDGKTQAEILEDAAYAGFSREIEATRRRGRAARPAQSIAPRHGAGPKQAAR